MNTFTELNLSAPLMQSIKEMGFETPSAIQAQTLPILLGEPTDFIGLAATGTGKTAAFSIPLLQAIDPQLKKLQGLILCPTRELALQVAEQINLLGKHLRVRVLPIYGGTGYNEQIYGLKSGANIVVGTPGRLIDHLERGTLKLDHLKTLILDEADEMISMGFKEDLEALLKASPRDKSKIWLFSATMEREVRRVADTYLKNPQHVQVNKKEMLSTTVEQIFFPVRENDKPEVICKLIDAADSFYGLIFCQTKSLVADLANYLAERGYKVDSLHGDKDQTSRERTMMAFRNRRVNVLVCTDVASRGLDVKDITHVINFSIPRELDNYVHRIGRTARSGKSGFAFNLVTAANRSLIPRIEKMTNSRMRPGTIPTEREIMGKKVDLFLQGFTAQTAFAKAAGFLSEEMKAQIQEMTPEEIMGRFLALRFAGVFEKMEGSRAPARQAAPHAAKPASKPAPEKEYHPAPEAPSKPVEKREDRHMPKLSGKPILKRDFAKRDRAKPEYRSDRKPSFKRDHAKPAPYAKKHSLQPAASAKPKSHAPKVVAPTPPGPAGNRAERRKHLQLAYANSDTAKSEASAPKSPHKPWTTKGKKQRKHG